MQLKIKYRDGPARYSNLEIDNFNILTPNIIYIKTDRIDTPVFADIVITNSKKVDDKPCLKVENTLFSKNEKKQNCSTTLSNYIVYPMDMNNKLHEKAIDLYEKNNPNLYILPGNIESLDKALEDNPASIFIIANAYQLFNKQSKFVEYIINLKTKIGFQKTIYLPTVGNPSSISLLTYMGIDFFDSTSAMIAARHRNLLFPHGSYNIETLDEIPCNCPFCKNTTNMNFNDILNHNYVSLKNEIITVRNSIKNGQLRELVENRVKSKPILTSILRILDEKGYEYLEPATPISKKGYIYANTKESLNRPDIKRFRKRIIQRYSKPVNSKVLLLLPCSAKKPYSFSKSHKRFRNVLFNLKNPNVIHEIIVTSPLGLVPRELEMTYPAASYDIPVTGIWDEDEKKIIRTMLSEYLAKNRYEYIVIHLPTVITDFIIDLFEQPRLTVLDNKTTSNASIEQLQNVLENITSKLENIKQQVRKREFIKSIASYQFGKEIAVKLIDNSIIKGKYFNQKIFQSSKQLGTLTADRGLISLTIEGGKILANANSYWVNISNDFDLKGSVFAPGIINADEKIRIGDEVVIIQNKKICAVGVAKMSGIEMKESSYGEAVKIRHHL